MQNSYQLTKAKRKRDTCSVFFGLIIISSLAQAIFNEDARDLHVFSLCINIPIGVLQMIIPLTHRVYADILISLIGIVYFPYFSYITENFNYFMAGWTMVTPTLQLFMTQNSIIFVIVILVQLVLPTFFKQIVKDHHHLLATDDGLHQFMIEKTISLLIASALILSFHRDISKSEQEATLAKKKAQESANQLKQFLQSFSHELRNPLNSLRGNLQLALQNENLPSSIAENIKTSSTCAEILMQLINNILDSGKFEQGSLEVDPTPSDMRQNITQVWTIFRTILQSKSLNGYVRISKSLPPKLMLDPVRTCQVLMNLISNAIKFTQSGKVEIIIDWIPSNSQHIEENIYSEHLEADLRSPRRLGESYVFDEQIQDAFSNFNQLSCRDLCTDEGYNYLNYFIKQLPPCQVNPTRPEKGILRISIIDTGAGMSEENLSKLFSKFGQFSTNQALRKIGTGLGLFITKEIIKAMKGDIKAFSQKGKGTAMVACIPTCSAQIEQEVELQQFIGRLVARKLKFQVVDDSNFNVRLIFDYVKKFKGEVLFHNYNGLEAFQKFCSETQRPVDIVITDIDMPGMDGIELSKKIRDHENQKRWERVKIIVISGNDCNFEAINKLKEERIIDKFLRKPICFEDLTRSVDEILN